MATTLSWTAFEGFRLLASGPRQVVALAVKRAIERGTDERILIYDDATGRDLDINTHGSDEDVIARLSPPAESAPPPGAEAAEPRPRGRPRLGVVAREITLLPRHWDWLNTQPGGASVALRKLVEEARRANAGADRRREARDAAYHFISSLAGNFPGFEEVARALFAGDRPRFFDLMAAWPADVRFHALRLAAAADDETA